MNVILDTSDDDGLAIEVGKNAAQITVQFLAQRFVAQEWPAFLGREDSMDENF